MKKIVLRVKDGVVTTLYTEALDLTQLGTLTVERASNVEYDNERHGWTIALVDPRGKDLRPILGVFATRQAALNAEIEYLQRRV